MIDQSSAEVVKKPRAAGFRGLRCAVVEDIPPHLRNCQRPSGLPAAAAIQRYEDVKEPEHGNWTRPKAESVKAGERYEKGHSSRLP